MLFTVHPKSFLILTSLLRATPTSRRMASWACSRCTFLNPPSQKSACQVCLSPTLPHTSSSASAPPPSDASPSASSALRWPCRACTFSNPFGTRACEVCGTRAAPFSSFLDLDFDSDEVSDPSIGSVFRPLQRCSTKHGRGLNDDVAEPRAEKMARREEVPSAAPGGFCAVEKMKMKEEVPSMEAGNVDRFSKRSVLKVLSYNVWFREDLEVHKRMKVLGDLIQQHMPDLICFQEVTPNIYEIFQNSNWWKAYACSVPQETASERAYFCMQMSKFPVKAFSCKAFTNSIMGRELCIADVVVGRGRSLVIATSHLESPCPAPPRWDQMYSSERVVQAKQSLSLLKGSPNAIFCGDMNWDDKLDGAFPLPDGWVDAWTVLRPGEDGWTYDTKSNQMLSGNRKLQKRLDRFICGLKDFEISSIEMIGMEAIPGLSYCKEKKVRNEYQKLVLPVLPSDHYGLLLTICSSSS